MNRSSLPYSAADLFPKAPPLILGIGIGIGSSSTITGGPSGTAGLGSSSSPFTAMHSNNSTVNKSAIRKFQRYVRRIFRPNSLDFESAVWDIFNLAVNPKKMYRSHYYKLQGRASYSRDDPSFLILLTGFLSISAVAWGLAYSPSVVDILKLIVYVVVVDFYITGAIIATCSWVLTNRLFNGTFALFGSLSLKYRVNYIDWGFCFDVHCNSFVVIWCLLYLLQFFLLPLLNIKKLIIALVLGNTLYFGAIGYYFVITFYGFNSLPFVSGGHGAKKLQMIILAGVLPVLAVLWFLSICFRLNVAYLMVHTYFN